MARPFSSADAKRLIDEHNRIKSQLSAVGLSAEQYRSEILTSSEALVAQEVLSVLKDIPIEEINRDKKEFRVKALREYGYSSIADISTTSVYTIASVHGISEDTAYSIKRIVGDIVSKARQGVKIKLSTDSKTSAATKLVTSISKYNRALPLTENCRQILNTNSRRIDYALVDISPSTNGVKWFFTSSANKQKATDAFNFLGQLLSSEYGKSSEETLVALDAINRSTNTEAWQDFSDNSIRFFNILEDINPGILGTDDAVYGLPEDLAREIQEECFFPDRLLCELRRYQEWGVKYILHQEQVRQYTDARIAYLQKHKQVSEYDSENLMYGAICDLLDARPQLSLGVICHQPLNMLIRDPHRLNEDECRYAMNTATHLDFLIYHRISRKPVLAIEVDGFHFHKQGTAQYNRDRMKDRILQLDKIPAFRFSTNGSGEIEKIAQALDAYAQMK